MHGILILIFTISLALSVIFRIPTVHELPEWVWYLFGYPQYELGWSVLFFCTVGYVVTWMLDRRNIHWVWYVLLATVLQFAFALLEGEGFWGILRNVVQSGHQQFVYIVSREYSISSIVYEYDLLVQQAGYTYAQTKPPGYLLVYVFLSHIFQWVVPIVPLNGISAKNTIAYQQIALGLACSAPIFASIWVVPFYKTLRAQCLLPVSKDTMLYHVGLPLILGITTSSFVLITHHADQFMGLPLSACMLYGVVYMIHTMYPCIDLDTHNSIRNIRLSFALGIFAYFMVYFSFSLIPVLWMVLCYYCIHIFGMQLQRTAIVQTVVSAIGGYGFIAVLMWTGFDYNPLYRYHAAMLAHQQWKNTMWSWDVCVLNAVEWLWWFGPVGVSLLCKASWRMLYRKSGWKLGVVCWSTVLLLLLFSNTKGEVARLWLFLLPWVYAWIGASGVLAQEKWRYLLLAQGVWLWAIHYGQDFW